MLTANEIIKALEELLSEKPTRTRPYTIIGLTTAKGTSIPLKDVLDLINRKNAEIKKKDTEIDIIIRKKETLRDELAEKQAEIERLKQTPKCIYSYDGEMIEYCVEGPCSVEKTIESIKTEAYKEFADRLCEGRVSNDPVVIAVKVELSELTERKEGEGK